MPLLLLVRFILLFRRTYYRCLLHRNFGERFYLCSTWILRKNYPYIWLADLLPLQIASCSRVKMCSVDNATWRGIVIQSYRATSKKKKNTKKQNCAFQNYFLFFIFHLLRRSRKSAFGMLSIVFSWDKKKPIARSRYNIYLCIYVSRCGGDRRRYVI